MNKNYPRRDGLAGLLGLSAVALLLAGCGDNSEVAPELLPNYYPLSVGSYRIYDVADTVWRNNVATASRFQFREQVVAAPEPDATGQPVYQVVRSRRNSAAEAWQADSVLTVTVAPLNVTEQFNNRRTVALVLPAVEGKSWNYNAFNSLDTIVAVTRLYKQVGQPLSINRGGQTYQFSNTVTTINDLSSAGSDNGNSKCLTTILRTTFAPNVGPVYRVRRRLTHQTNNICEKTFNALGQSRNEVLIESGK